MIQALPLRPDYQRPALDARYASEAQRAAIVLPTGAGKAVVIAHQCMEFNGRTLILVHTDELATQLVDKLAKVAPHLEVGKFMGVTKDLASDVVVGGVLTVVRHLDTIGRFGQLVIDECHRSAAPSYMKIMTHLGVFTPGGPRLTGYTATLGRSDSKSLGRVYDGGVVFSRDISWMIRRQYLVPPVGRIVQVPDLDLSRVRSAGGEYRDDELGEAVGESLAPELVAAAFLEHGAGRKAIGFAPTVALAWRFADAFEQAGISSDVIHGGLDMETRKAVLKRHKAGDFRVLWNCAVLVEGYDDPTVNAVIIGPVRSKNRYQQMAGRGLRVDLTRPYEGQDCLLLGYAPTVLSHDLRSIIDLSDRPIKQATDGKSLIELEDELDAGEGVPMDAPDEYHGPVVVGEFDPIGRPSTRVWLRTAAGTYFVPAGTTHYVFVMEWPGPGEWSVASLALDERRPRMSEHRALELGEALVWAEDLALELGAGDLNTARKAPWRKRVASDKMQAFAKRLGLKPAGETRESGLWECTERAGALADRIAVVQGTRRLDPIATKVKGK